MTDRERELVEQQASMLKCLCYLQERYGITERDEIAIKIELLESLYESNREDSMQSVEEIYAEVNQQIYQI